MRATSHGDHLVQLANLKISNAYLVREDDGLTLIDTSLAGSAKAIIAAAQELGQPIKRIALTHAHNDHYGSLDALHKALPDAEVLVSARDAKLLKGDRGQEPGEPKGRLFPAVFLPPAKTAPTRTIAEGDHVGSLEVVAAPGHTPGQLAFLDTRDRSLICGDAYLALGGLFVTTQPVLRFPVPALLGTWHKPTAYATAVKLRALDPARLATGHGPVLDRPGAEMDRAIAAAPQS
jgi:glyoxylase-like metal-dependent hydrolase (beta-lactamase superfamily II)